MFESKTIDESSDRRMIAIAAGELGVDGRDVAIKPNDELDRAGCWFFVATSTAQPVHQVSNFATLPDGRVAGVDFKGNPAAAALLKACGDGAPANWWAAVVARFSDEVNGLVLTADGNPFAIRRVRDAGVDFTPPALLRAAGATTVSFFVMDVAQNHPSQIRATLDANGKLEVEKKVLAGAASKPAER